MRWVGVFALFVLAGFCGQAVAAEPDARAVAFFESKVRPILLEHCCGCHGDTKQKGGLRLDSRAGWQTGGDRGPAIVPGKPDSSLLIKAVRRDAGLQMPPKEKLPAAVVADLEEWVRLGAPDPRDGKTPGPGIIAADAGRAHWAFRPVARPNPPAVKETSWPRGDIDRFILARLEAQRLTPAPEADRHTWLRRVCLDLTGLPPSVEEVQAFNRDTAPDAHAKVVDRLLASPAFGERWARHWLDLVGYADQLGSANDIPAVHAWRYRDYVIRSLNADKPFDRFIREQLAGDLMSAVSEEERCDNRTATGFLVLGPVNIVESDKTQLRMDVVDQQLQKIGTTFLGLTLGCARCHDHKFDPISQADYYALAGILASTESVQGRMRGVFSDMVYAPLPETPAQQADRQRLLREHDQQADRLREQRTGTVRQREEVEKQLTSTPKVAELEKRKAELDSAIANLDKRLMHLDFIRPAPPVAYAVRDVEKPADAHITLRGNAHSLGASVPRGFVRVLMDRSAPAISPEASGRIQLAEWLVHPSHPLTARVTVNRIWQKLFGEGLVRSGDYFGLRGEPPSHPPLLDYLASEFVRGGWSQKRLIRQIVLSSAYRMGSGANTRAQAADPDNRLLWRMNRRRLEAEAIRDAVLAVSGDMLPSAGGPALPLQMYENVGNLDPKSPNPVSFSLTKFADDQLHRRSVYLPILRSAGQRGPAEILNLFDFAQPGEYVGRRPVTTAAPQALFLMNGPLLKQQAGKLADWVTGLSALDDRDRAARLYLRVLNRPATDAEVTEAVRFVSEYGPPRDAWAAYCHALLASNEFLFRL